MLWCVKIILSWIEITLDSDDCMNCMPCEGRQMIEHTKKLVEDKFTTLNGYEHTAEVWYLEISLYCSL